MRISGGNFQGTDRRPVAVSAIATPVRPEQFLLLGVVRVERAPPGVVQAVGDPARDVLRRGRHERTLGLILDRDDPFQRLLGLLAGLGVPDEVQHLVAVLRKEAAGDGHVADRVAVVDAPARGTAGAMRRRGSSAPGPAAVVVDGAAVRADRGLGQLFAGLVGVVSLFGPHLVATFGTVVAVRVLHRGGLLASISGRATGTPRSIPAYSRPRRAALPAINRPR